MVLALSLAFIFSTIVGIDHPARELTMMAYNGAKNSGGIEGGTGLKLAVNIPNLLIFRSAETLLNGIVEFRLRFSAQLVNSKSLLCRAVHRVPLSTKRYLFVGYSLSLPSSLHTIFPEFTG
jgi:hypothetical protein